MKKLLTAITLVFTLALSPLTNAYAINSYDIGVEMAWGKCLPKKVKGTFKLQTRLAGTSSWTTQGTTVADDGSGGDGSECAKWQYWIFWTPKQVGALDLRVVNGTKVFESTKIKVTNTGPYATTAVSYVTVPRLIGTRDGAARSWLRNHGYKFSVEIANIGYNPKQSCMMSGNNLVLKQSPAAGSRVANQPQTWFRIFVDCEWR